MGAACCEQSEQDHPLEGKEQDLPAMSLIGITDTYQRFELSLPFSRTLIKRFLGKLSDAEKNCGDEGFVTIEALEAQFQTDAWKGLSEPDSALYKFLTSGAFKDETKGHTAVQIDCDFLRCFALLHCGGKLRDKAIAFYGVLQEGGIERHEFISAQDKDLNPIFLKIVGLCHWELFTAAAQVGGVDEIYTDEEKQTLEECVEAFREDVYLEDVFGVLSRKENEEWLDATCKSTPWIFNSKELRKKIFESAGITERHHNASPLGN